MILLLTILLILIIIYILKWIKDEGERIIDIYGSRFYIEFFTTILSLYIIYGILRWLFLMSIVFKIKISKDKNGNN